MDACRGAACRRIGHIERTPEPCRHPWAHLRVVLLDIEHDIEPDAVHEPEGWDSRSSEDLLHPVHVFERSNAFFDNHQAFARDRRPDPIEDEAVALPPHMEGHEPVLRQLAH
jgi:hypothetical protein